MDAAVNTEYILRSEVMKQVDSGEEFDMVFITCDRNRGTGGELIRVRNWAKLSHDDNVDALPGQARKKAKNLLRNPNHWKNKTINIWNPGNRTNHPHKIHWRLIQFFNGKRVLNG